MKAFVQGIILIGLIDAVQTVAVGFATGALYGLCGLVRARWKGEVF